MRASRGIIARAFRDCVPVMAGYIVMGIGFGILMSAKGYGVLWAIAMGIIIYLFAQEGSHLFRWEMNCAKLS